ncbi:MAG TPA: response regulator transcription factor [Chitinophagales bacterium]|nr:response regulator transcription factor [Chitinophagales bacterium]
MNHLRILIADDHPAVRYGIRSVLQLEKNITIAGEVSNGDEVLAFLEKQPVDLVILDLNMPGKDGIDTARKLRKTYPNLKILAFSIYDDRHRVMGMLKAGADGYLLKSADSNQIMDAINTVMKGEKYISQEVASKVVFDVVSGNVTTYDEEQPSPPLSRREKEVLRLLTHDNSYSEIARKLGISKRTVDTHRYNITKKLGIKTIAGLIRYAMDHGIA